MTRRLARVDDLLRTELSEALRRELRDPSLADIASITRVATSPDLRHAKVYVSVRGEALEKRSAVSGLQRAAPYLRHLLGGRLALRRVPDLDFRLDETLEAGDQVLGLIRLVGPETDEVPAEEAR